MTLFRNSVFKILYWFKIGNYLLYRNKKKSKVPVIVFHKIIPEYDSVWPGIHPRLFEEMILLLKKHYSILPLHYLHTQPEMDFTNACFITFDDGYTNYLDYAYPVLKKHNAHSTLFVLPFNISNNGHIWTSTVIFFIKHYSFSDIKDFFLQHNQDIDYSKTPNDFSLNLAITKHLCLLHHLERQKIVSALLEKFENDNRVISKELLSFEELKKLDEKHVTIASHSLTHPSFIQETDLEFIEFEIAESKNIIEEKLNIKVSSFAFPFARVNELSLKVVKKHYAMCFTKINELVSLSKLKEDRNYLYELPRFNIHQGSAEELFLLINGFHKMIKPKPSLQ
ncbi:polysaccharide deacetylase family protein [Aurantibacillus circumpalustris]|uniref:polysaccharide deacetylase family protein n=1 Tax=Aurantibacillus circumpalustris TaxID=3036359 RepID=UPI00295B9A08|nr:polysaccharide deacetylase family protein [Aurantibacillus circumpalustris]